MECFEGLKLRLVQPVDEKGNEAGGALVAFDVARAGEGDLVIFEAGKEAAQANPNGWFNPADAAILGVVDAVNVAGNTATAVNVAAPVAAAAKGGRA
jgi:ethanolamine utilization protein EutN